MQIKRLKLSGFKSFVEPAELRIEHGLTGIVGPNGCGKSNLLEAIRWAMGESSPKSLRGGGMDDVIFAGTASRPARDFAEVSMLIGTQGNDAAGGGESEVTRRIERGSGSAYRIDGRDVRAKDVALLFADAATGAHSPALVSQGKIGAVIAAKPVERRQLLEEAAGISGLHARRKDAEQKLRATETNLTRLGEILSDQEQRASQLRRQARAAERYRNVTREIRTLEAQLLHGRWLEAERAAQAATMEAQEASQDVDRLHAAIAQMQATQVSANAALAERRLALTELREQGHALAHQLAAARAQRNTVVRRLAELDRLDASLAADMDREEALRGDAARAIAQLEGECAAITQRLQESEIRSAQSATELSAAEAASRETESALADLLGKQAAMLADRRLAEVSAEAARAQLAQTELEVRKLGDQLAALGDGSDEVDIRAAAEAKATAAATALTASEKARLEAEEGRNRAADARDAAESVVASVRAALSAAKSEHDALARAVKNSVGAAIASLKAKPGYEHALAAALGDDADAAIGHDGPRRWQGSPPLADDPELASGLECLAAHAEAPPELHRRLNQVGVAEADLGQPLAVGQRLVTRDGWLRRWDGFVALGSGAALAERLLRANRLARLATELPGLQDAVTAALAERDRALAAMNTCRNAAEEARSAGLAAERDARDATRTIDAATARLERLESNRAVLRQRQEELHGIVNLVRAAAKASERSLAALPDAAALDDELEHSRAAAAKAASAVAERRAEAATKARETAADRERSSAASKEQVEWCKRLDDAAQRLASALERQRQQDAERTDLEIAPGQLDATIVELEHANLESEARIGEWTALERSAEEAVIAAGRQVTAANERSAAMRERRAAAAARAEAQEARSAELSRHSVDKFECVPQRLPQKMGFDGDEPRNSDKQATTLERLCAERERIGPVNLVAEQELTEVDAARRKGAEEAQDLTQAIHRLRGSIGNLNREGRLRLLDAYEKVDGHFRRLFTTLFEGGQAHLALVESDDPLEAGLEIMAQPPGKRLATLTLLSGGEQALTAIALIFAIFLTNPAPICVLDEVDAPLDDANVERFCALLQGMILETETRYLIVTHNAVTMSRMDRLYGVTMIEKGVSRLVSVDLGAAETLLAAE